jgi:STE24 endopeptidase
MNPVASLVAALIFARWLALLWLEWLNQHHARAHADAVPEAFREFITPANYAQSVQYTTAKSRLHQVESTYDTVLLVLLLWSGVLPWAFQVWTGAWGASAWADGGFLFVVGLVLGVAGLPLDWHAQFRLEARFGFNTTTAKLWWLDRARGLLLGVLLGYPLLVLVLKVVEWTGAGWWLWAWGCVVGFQALMLLLAPVLILPLFNKFTPLPEGGLRDRLLALAGRTGFRARSIQVMDGSKRSRHSNAFFTGFGRFRKIVLFDTLVAQLGEAELEAVLAHEIAHFKKKHVPKMVLVSAAGLLAGFYALAWLARQEWFAGAFGFEPGRVAPVFLLFGLLAGAVTFWLTPVASGWSRRYEYQADAFAARALGQSAPLIGALRKLSEKNLSNLAPHPLYSRFHYSHPTLLEREEALRGLKLEGAA